MKTIMIVGAGEAQVPLIEAAVKANYHTVVCDIDRNAPGVRIADEYCMVSTQDREGLLKTAREKHIDGITANSEYAMTDVAYIANDLGLIGNPVEAIETLSSKSRFRAFQQQSGLFAPNYTVDKRKIKDLKYPLIIKPDQSSGSRGTTVICHPEDRKTVERSITDCSALSRNGQAIIEEYIEIPDPTTVEGEIFIHNGKILWDGLFSTMRGKNAPMLPMTYFFPIRESEQRLTLAKEALTAAFKFANIKHGEYNMEMFFTSDVKPFIIEINPRQGGKDIPHYVHEHNGIDYYKLLVTTSMGDDHYWNAIKDRPYQNRNIIHHLLFPDKCGRYKGLEISPQIKDCIYNIKVDIAEGTELKGTTDASSCIGYVDLRFDDTKTQWEIGLQIEDLIRVVVG